MDHMGDEVLASCYRPRTDKGPVRAICHDQDCSEDHCIVRGTAVPPYCSHRGPVQEPSPGSGPGQECCRCVYPISQAGTVACVWGCGGYNGHGLFPGKPHIHLE